MLASMTDIRLAVGDTAPDFTHTDDKGGSVSLTDFSGKKVVVYFSPKADPPA